MEIQVPHFLTYNIMLKVCLKEVENRKVVSRVWCRSQSRKERGVECEWLMPARVQLDRKKNVYCSITCRIKMDGNN